MKGNIFIIFGFVNLFIGEKEENSAFAQCDEGYFEKESDCMQCPIGMYQENKNQTSCEECPLYASTLNPGSKSKNDCIVVDPIACLDSISPLENLNWTVLLDQNLTKELCISSCSYEGYIFAGYVNISYCTCDDHLPLSTNQCVSQSLIAIFKTRKHNTVIYNANGMIIDLSDYHINLTGHHGIQFEVRACNDANLRLLGNPSNPNQDYVHIIIGGGSNTFWGIKNQTTSYLFYLQDTDIVDCNIFKPFWLDWTGSIVRVGKGPNPFQSEVGKYNFEVDINVNAVQLRSYANKEQCWKFFTAYEGEQDNKQCQEIIIDSTTVEITSLSESVNTLSGHTTEPKAEDSTTQVITSKAGSTNGSYTEMSTVVTGSKDATTTADYVLHCVNKKLKSNLTKEEQEQIIAEIIASLTINVRETSKYKRSLSSASDTRLSAVIMGTVLGPLVLVILFSLVVIIDLPNIWHMFRDMKTNLKRCFMRRN